MIYQQHNALNAKSSATFIELGSNAQQKRDIIRMQFGLLRTELESHAFS